LESLQVVLAGDATSQPRSLPVRYASRVAAVRDGDRLLYVGMSGRAMSAEDLAAAHFARSAEAGAPEAVTALVCALRHTWSQHAHAEAFVLVDRYRWAQQGPWDCALKRPLVG
jgi:hypothetical protein